MGYSDGNPPHPERRAERRVANAVVGIALKSNWQLQDWHDPKG